MSKVASLFGGPTGVPEPNAGCIAALEDFLQKAKAGEVVGVAIAALHYDRLSSYAVAGQVGGYGLIGALEVVKVDIVEAARL